MVRTNIAEYKGEKNFSKISKKFLKSKQLFDNISETKPLELDIFTNVTIFNRNKRHAFGKISKSLDHNWSKLEIEKTV